MARKTRVMLEVCYAISMIPLIYIYSYLIWPMYNSTMMYLESGGQLIGAEENWDFIFLVIMLVLVFRLGLVSQCLSRNRVVETIIFISGMIYFSRSYFVSSFFSLNFIFLAVLPILFSLLRLFLMYKSDDKKC